MTPTSELRESCGHRTGDTRLKALPEPELQRVEADEARVRAQEQVLMSAVLGSLPGEFQCLDVTRRAGVQARSSLCVTGFGGKADDLGERTLVECHRCRRIELRWAVVTNAKYCRVWRPIVTVMLGVIDS